MEWNGSFVAGKKRRKEKKCVRVMAQKATEKKEKNSKLCSWRTNFSSLSLPKVKFPYVFKIINHIESKTL